VEKAQMTSALPPGITCTDWLLDDSDPKGRKCIHYAKFGPGTCGMIDVRMMCSEWLKRNNGYQANHSAPKALPIVPAQAPAPSPAPVPALPSAAALLAPPPPKVAPSAPPPPPSATDSAGHLRLVPSESPTAPTRPGGSQDPAKRLSAAEVARRAHTLGLVESGAVATYADPPAHEPCKAIDLASVEALAAAHPEITLTSPELGEIVLVAKVTGQDRLEVTFSDMATIRLITDAIPGCRVMKIERRKK
jgi:hypothetical protein